MEIISTIDSLPIINKPVCTLGVFDGVHLAHQAMLNHLKSMAQSLHGSSVVITFDTHPCKIVSPQRYGKELFILTSLDEKIERFKHIGIDYLWILPFTRHFANLSYERFIETIFLDRLKPQALLMGYNHNFGNDRQGTFARVKTALDQMIHVEQYQQIDYRGQRISSTEIRNLLLVGNIQQAENLLGYPYLLSGSLNQTHFSPETSEKLIPAFGSYEVVMEIDGTFHDATCSIGPEIHIHGSMPSDNYPWARIHFTENKSSYDIR